MKHLKLFFALFAMLALGVTNAWGADFTLTSANSVTVDGVTVTFAKGSGSTAPAWYAAGLRLYAKNTVTITSESEITSIVFDWEKQGSKTFASVSANTGSYSHPSAAGKGTWTGSSKSVIFTLASTSGVQLQLNTLSVTTANGGGDEPPTPDPGTGGEALSYTWDLSTNSYSAASTNQVTWSAADVNMVIDKASAQTNANNYLPTAKTSTRFYKNSKLTITPAANVTITSIVFAATTTDYASALKNSTWTNASASVSGATVTVTPTNGASAISATISGTCGFTGVTVHYTKATSGEPEPVIVKSLKSIAVTAMKTTYEQGDIFKFNGTCTATYSVTKDGVAQADETAEVTPTSVSTPNMNTIGTQTVTVTYSEGGVEKTAEYQITITENTVTAGEYCITPNNEFWGTNFNGTISGDALNQVYTGRQDDITVQYSKGSGSNLYINNTQTRTYNGTALTIFAPNGYVITAIAFTADGSNWAGTHTANVGTMTDSKNWAGSANEVTITFGGTCRVTKICVTYEAAPVEPTKTLTSIEITTPATQTTFWQGETFNHKDLVVTAHYSDAADEVITPTVTGSTATAGTATVNVSYKEQSTSYTITVKAIPNTKETAYTVADAFDIIDKLTTANGVFISGTISQIDSHSDQYKSITYWISADGTTTKQLQVYSGKGLESADFAAVTDLSVGDQVIVCGILKKYSGTYEFDKNNYLASHTPTTKDPAGLAYATTSYAANVGEPFTTPELTNPHNLTVTYATSDASKATVDVNTGAVTIVAAGEVTITASTTGDATHDAGSASYNITITDPSLAVATLPFYFDGKKADIEGTAGMTQEGIDSDYNAAPYLKFNTAGDWAIVQFNSEPGEFSFLLKQNGQNAGTFTVYESANGEDYTPIWSGGDLGGNGQSATIEPTLSATARYVKFEYTTKGNSTNYALGSISIAKPDFRQEAGLAWSVESVNINQGDEFTPPTLSNDNGLTLTCSSTDESVATVTSEGVITLAGAIGTTTITASFAGNEDYKAAEVSCKITVNKAQLPTGTFALYSGDIVEGDYVITYENYAMKAADDDDSDRLDFDEIAPEDNKINNPSSMIVWHVLPSGEYWAIYNEYVEKYAASITATKNKATLVDEVNDNAKWSVSGDETYEFVNYERANSTTDNNNKYLRKNNQYGFACYAQATGGKLTLYRKQTPYTVTVAACTNGSVNASGVVDTKALSGDIITLSNTPEFDYQFVGYNVYKTGDETTVITVTNGTFTMPAFDVTISATFEVIQQTTAKSGKFSTGKYEYAEFATGNLQYNTGTDKWRFAKQQYQVVGEDNIYVGKTDYEGWIDMFGWSNGDANNFGVNASNDNQYYTGTFVDWGTKMGEGWSTLSKDQWDYLLNKRDASLKQIAKVGDMLGIMLFPDEWTLPAGCEPVNTLNHDPEDGENTKYDFYSQNYTLAQWTELEKEGAVFLPAAGRRTGGWGNETISPHMQGILGLDSDGHYKYHDNTNYHAYYWTSTYRESDNTATYLHNIKFFGNNDATVGQASLANEQGRYGQSVRLAKVTSTLIEIGDGDNSAYITANEGKEMDVQVKRTFKSNDGYYTICLPFNIDASEIGKAYQVTSISDAGAEGFNMVFTEVTGELEAGQPYLILPKDLTNPIFENVTIVNTTGSSVQAEGAGITFEMIGAVNGGGQTEAGQYWVGDGGYFYNNNGNPRDKLGLRVYFNIKGMPAGMRARVVVGENAATGLDNITNDENTTIKVIENGQLIIIRNGEKFNAQGVRF